MYSERLFFDDKSVKSPYKDPKIDAIVILIQHPIIPVNDPISNMRSKSPSPIPFLLRKYLNMELILNKKKYPNSAPKMLSLRDNGNKSYALKVHPSGTRKVVAKREMSMVSISERIVTINAEKNMKYAKK